MTMKNGTLTSNIQGGKMKLWFARLVIMVLDPIYWWAHDFVVYHYIGKKYYDSNLDQ